jgi:predicted nucleic acid-binding protein
MSREVLLDTNGWFALLNSADSLHAKAVQTCQENAQSGCLLVVTDWVIAETGNGLARRKRRHRFAEAVTQIQASASVEIVYVGPDLLQRALNLYASHMDKAWGLVDCASFVLMRERGITDAFTNDRHFQQAGFNCLLTL